MRRLLFKNKHKRKNKRTRLHSNQLGHLTQQTRGSWTEKDRSETGASPFCRKPTATYTAKKRSFKFVNIQATVVVGVRCNCWFNSSCCSVIFCTWVVSEISVTACMSRKNLKTRKKSCFFVVVVVVNFLSSLPFCSSRDLAYVHFKSCLRHHQL